MKRKLLSAITVIALMTAIAVMTAPKVGALAVHTGHCLCGGSMSGVGGHICSDEAHSWVAVSNSTAYDKTTGKGSWIKNVASQAAQLELTDSTATCYYLDGDVTIDPASGRTALVLKAGTAYTICLNGHTLDLGDVHITLWSGSLNICDCVGGGKLIANGSVIQIPNSGAATDSNKFCNQFGGILESRNQIDTTKPMITVSAGTYRMYGGEIRYTQAGMAGAPVKSGGTVSVVSSKSGDNYQSAIFYLYGGKITGREICGRGGTIYVNNANGAQGVTAQLIAAGGEITGGTAKAWVNGTSVSDGCGGNLYIGADSYLELSDCRVTGGTAMAQTNASGALANGEGGNVYSTSAAVTVIKNGTQITGGTAHTGGGMAAFGTVTISDSVFSRNESSQRGGNIFLLGNAECSITNTDILAGQAVNGGNIYAGTNATRQETKRVLLQVDNCRILDGLSRAAGGNLYLTNGCEAELKNTQILRGISLTSGGNLCVTKSATYNPSEDPLWRMIRPAVTIDGCTLHDGVASTGYNAYVNQTDLVVKGATVINNMYSNEPRNLYVTSNTGMDFNGLTEGADIGVSGRGNRNDQEAASNIYQTGVTYQVLDYLHYDVNYYYFTVEGEPGSQYLRSRPYYTHYHCECGGISTDPDHVHTDVEFTPWDGTATLYSGDHVYLTQNDSTTSTGTRHTYTDKDLCICLCGQDMINVKGTELKTAGTTSLTVCDCHGGGRIMAQGRAPSGSTYYDGGVINCAGEGTSLKLYGVTVGRTDIFDETRIISNHGGGIYSSGSVYLEDVTVLGGYARYGGNIYMAQGSDLTIRGKTSILEGYCTEGGMADGILFGTDCTSDFSGDLVVDSADSTDIRFSANGICRLHDLTTQDIFNVRVSNSAPFAVADRDYRDLLRTPTADKVFAYNPATGELSLIAPTVKVEVSGEEKSFASLQDAVNEADSGAIVRLQSGITEDFSCTKDLYLDVNGNSLTGTVHMNGKTFYGMDTSTDGYTDSTGGFTGTVVDGTLADHSRNAANKRRYVTVKEADGSYTFNRIYVGVTRIAYNTSREGVGYKTTIVMNPTTTEHLYADTNGKCGITLWLSKDSKRSYAVAPQDITAGEHIELTAVITGQFEAVAQGKCTGETPVYAEVYANMQGASGEPFSVVSSTYNYTLKQIMSAIDGEVPKLADGSSNLNNLIKTYLKYDQILSKWMPELRKVVEKGLMEQEITDNPEGPCD